jgi:hypothetical protein
MRHRKQYAVKNKEWLFFFANVFWNFWNHSINMSEVRVRRGRTKLFAKLSNVIENCSLEDCSLKKKLYNQLVYFCVNTRPLSITLHAKLITDLQLFNIMTTSAAPVHIALKNFVFFCSITLGHVFSSWMLKYIFYATWCTPEISILLPVFLGSNATPVFLYALRTKSNIG